MIQQSKLQGLYHTPLARFLLWLLISLLLINVSMQVLFPKLAEGTQLDAIKKFLTIARSGGDSWGAMIEAIDYVSSKSELLLYDKVFFEDHVKFQYPPSSLLFIHVLRQYLITTYSRLAYLLDIVGWIAVLVTFLVSIKLFFLSQKEYLSPIIGYLSIGNSVFQVGLLFSLCLLFYPVVKGYAIGQVQTWLDALFALMCLLWLRGNKRASGILVAIMMFYKPQYGLILVWGLTRREWKFMTWAGITLAIGTSVSILAYGLENHLNYLKALSYMSQHGESFYPNNSVNGLLNRFLFNGNNTYWAWDQFAPYNPIVYYSTLISSFIFVVCSLILPRYLRGSIFDFFLISLTSTLASPIAWEHHYGIMLPMFMYLIPFLYVKRMFGSSSNILLWLAYVCCASFLPIMNLLAETRLNFLQSYLFIGALMVIVCLYIVCSRERSQYPSIEGAAISIT